MKYNLSKIMLKAWEIYRKYNIKFGEALHRAWLSAKAEEVNAKRIEVSKKAYCLKDIHNNWSEINRLKRR